MNRKGDKSLIVGLDIGTSKVVALVGEYSAHDPLEIIGIGSHVKGAVKVNKSSFSLSLTPPRKPRIVIGPRAVVDGPLTFEREVSLYVHATATIGNVSGASVQRFDTNVAPKE